ncbi:MAG: holo-ACP synthase [Nevskia sp.]|jgi:holo-[acyl-carrier protein] synthase|nr:holo-ACP synthase [Nevskia sp.]MCK9383447.1 holo-ACP synthase [Nevskia sp.]
MIYGVGADLLRIERGEQLWQRHGERAAAKLLHLAERPGLAASRNPGHYLARAFSAKEAFVKALGTGFRGVSYHDVGAVRAPEQRPQLVFSEAMQARLQQLGITGAHLSFSDEGGMILAFVVLETSGEPAVIR